MTDPAQRRDANPAEPSAIGAHAPPRPEGPWSFCTADLRTPASGAGTSGEDWLAYVIAGMPRAPAGIAD